MTDTSLVDPVVSQTPLVQVFGEYRDLTCDKVAIVGQFDKYTNLEETAFAHFGHHRDEYSLHFHLESHDRCQVKLKPTLWDKGAYFVSSLLKEDSLQVIPHFWQKHHQSLLPQKRAAPSPKPIDDVAPKPPPQKQENNTSERTTEVQYNEVKPLGTVRNQHASSSTPHSLPTRLNYSCWAQEHTRLKQQYIEKNYPGILVRTGDSKYRYACCRAHIVLIEGDYGITAPVSCERCAKMGHECRIYNTQYYNWETAGRGAKTDLGWRCSSCRLGGACVFPVGRTGKAVEPHKDFKAGDQSAACSPLGSADLQSSIAESSAERNELSAQFRNDAPTQQRNLPSLPASITYSTWIRDFTAARQAYFKKHEFKGSKPKHHDEYANMFAHRELIRGQYGVRAAMACENCSDREQECRTYHLECYQWTLEGNIAKGHLGWRCAGCRSYGSGVIGGCNVRLQ